jgi:hypothetical protein
LAKVYVEVEVEPGVAFHRVAAQHKYSSSRACKVCVKVG